MIFDHRHEIFHIYQSLPAIDYNLPLLAKVGWNLHTRKNTLWCKIMQNKYFSNETDFPQAKGHGLCSPTEVFFVLSRSFEMD